MSVPVLVLTDIHGCFYTMVRLLNSVPRGVRLVFAGDLIDRGLYSRKVVEFAMQHNIPVTMGNHEDLCVDFYRPGHARCSSFYSKDVWLENGGLAALRNWPVTPGKDKRSGYHRMLDSDLGGAVPMSVVDWFVGLPAYFTPSTDVDENGRTLLVSHTGYGLAAIEDDWVSVLWGGHGEDGPPFPEDHHFRVFGHTRNREAIVTDTYANIDTGAAYVKRGYGLLSALVWPSKQVLTQVYDETPVEPRFNVVDGCIVD